MLGCQPTAAVETRRAGPGRGPSRRLRAPRPSPAERRGWAASAGTAGRGRRQGWGAGQRLAAAAQHGRGSAAGARAQAGAEGWGPMVGCGYFPKAGRATRDASLEGRRFGAEGLRTIAQGGRPGNPKPLHRMYHIIALEGCRAVAVMRSNMRGTAKLRLQHVCCLELLYRCAGYHVADVL